MAMMDPQAIAVLPLWQLGLWLTGGAVIGATIVEGTARGLISRKVRAEHNTAASAVFTVVGTTYAVLLAFIAMLALEGYNRAQAVTGHEASLVEEVFQLLSGLSGPGPADAREDIVAYTRYVVTDDWPAEARVQSVSLQMPALQRPTQGALHTRPDDPADATRNALLLEEVTALGTARRERLIAARTSIPAIVWFVLIAGGGISVVFASLLGAPKLAMQLAMSSLLALSGAVVLLVIVALSDPFESDLAISDQPFQGIGTMTNDFATELRTYVIGVVLAAILSAIPFTLVALDHASRSLCLWTIPVCGLSQVMVHFRCFLHIDLSRQKRDDLQLILFSTLIVLLMVGGTIWITVNQHRHMM
jgi:cytochrome o ubiquinol oxidase operon protein cyoD